MASLVTGEITELLERWSSGDDEALNRLTPLVYDELRRLAAGFLRGERIGHTLQATALVHEAYLKLAGFRNLPWKNRSHFIGVVVTEMRRILVDHARRHCAGKRGGGARADCIEDLVLASRELSPLDLLAIDEALNKLAVISKQQCRIFDARFFGGLTIEEAADYLDLSEATVERGYRAAKAFVGRELGY
ncbi:MAG TPA: ECF-type sigma factor [Pyrinomonadaceae bacterium]|nr:ECF-type sigma factor [Pyrinomonadaceae bacterium]